MAVSSSMEEPPAGTARACSRYPSPGGGSRPFRRAPPLDDRSTDHLRFLYVIVIMAVSGPAPAGENMVKTRVPSSLYLDVDRILTFFPSGPGPSIQTVIVFALAS